MNKEDFSSVLKTTKQMMRYSKKRVRSEVQNRTPNADCSYGTVKSIKMIHNIWPPGPEKPNLNKFKKARKQLTVLTLYNENSVWAASHRQSASESM